MENRSHIARRHMRIPWLARLLRICCCLFRPALVLVDRVFARRVDVVTHPHKSIGHWLHDCFPQFTVGVRALLVTTAESKTLRRHLAVKHRVCLRRKNPRSWPYDGDKHREDSCDAAQHTAAAQLRPTASDKQASP